MPLWGIQVSVDGQMLSFFGFGSVRYPLPLDDPHRNPCRRLEEMTYGTSVNALALVTAAE